MKTKQTKNEIGYWKKETNGFQREMASLNKECRVEPRAIQVQALCFNENPAHTNPTFPRITKIRSHFI